MPEIAFPKELSTALKGLTERRLLTPTHYASSFAQAV